MYATPTFFIGQTVQCLARGPVTIAGQTDAPIPWPIGKDKSLVLYGDLAEALRNESTRTVSELFGVSVQTVSKYRKALGLLRKASKPSQRPDHVIKVLSPELAAERLGLPVASVLERRRELGLPNAKQVARKPYQGSLTPEQVAIIRSHSQTEAARILGISPMSVGRYRQMLGVSRSRWQRRMARRSG